MFNKIIKNIKKELHAACKHCGKKVLLNKDAICKECFYKGYKK